MFGGTQNSSCESPLRAHPSLEMVNPPAIALWGPLSPEDREFASDGRDSTACRGAFQTRTVESPEPETMDAPSGENATERTPS
ncbi:unnamed protein product [Rhizoctonia solani]|uniref:Uncharacterized protein n=1 Tax=Rhizoctonia solani TaxID=456999 RepID=A0A8H3AXP6_9AGAM|nr:unnamed protein product [Rhizoctonia solani]